FNFQLQNYLGFLKRANPDLADFRIFCNSSTGKASKFAKNAKSLRRGVDFLQILQLTGVRLLIFAKKRRLKFVKPGFLLKKWDQSRRDGAGTVSIWGYAGYAKKTITLLNLCCFGKSKDIWMPFKNY
ncbi:MAG: hypothetical protein LBR67_09815, partial [Dysgonamonadaceae bacterium]|nr:hypothetical protein [Dysgonamonadaceae bacterium]